MGIHYKFLFSPNNSGTTVMSQYLAANIVGSYLPPFGNNEGQMAPMVRKMMRGNDAWKNNAPFDWKSIKQEWDKLAEKDGKIVFLESSPPNIMRVSDILKNFEDCEYVFSISSPYSYIASHLFSASKSFNLKKIAESGLSSKIKMVTEIWIEKAQTQKLNIGEFDGASRKITYEEFCAFPGKLLELMNASPSEDNAHVLSVDGKKNSRVREIVNMLPKHLAFLGLDGIYEINSVLVEYRDLIDWFGYSILSVHDVNSILSESIALALDGQRRRFSLESMVSKAV